MTKIITGLRILLGLIFFVFGLNGFIGFINPPPMPDAALAFMGALANTGYMFPLIKATEVLAGALLLSGFYVPLACLLLAPITVNIFFFHLFLAFSPDGAIGLLSPFMLIGVAWGYRRYFRDVLVKKAQIDLG